MVDEGYTLTWRGTFERPSATEVVLHVRERLWNRSVQKDYKGEEVHVSKGEPTFKLLRDSWKNGEHLTDFTLTEDQFCEPARSACPGSSCPG